MKNLLKGKIAVSLMTAISLLVFMTGIAAAKGAATTKDEKKLKTEISMLDKDAALPNGDRVVIDRLSKEFNVTGDQIRTLHEKKLGYGEIATIYAFADKMSGGITDDNVNKVMGLHEGKKGWGTIAKSLDVDLGAVVSKVKGIEKDAHSDIRKAAAERPAAGKGAGGREKAPGKSKPSGGY